MRVCLSLLFLFLLTSCATKYVVPGNRFLTPESQGGVLAGQIEFQQTAANTLQFDGSNGSLDDGVKYSKPKRSGYMSSTSILEQVDLIWSNVAEANSMFGGKYQIMGGSRSSKAVGNKLSVVGMIGSNSYKDEQNGQIDFELTGKEFMLIYGYRFSELILPYSGLSYSVYDFKGQIYSGSLAGKEPDYKTSVIALNNGIELAYEVVFMKFELSYQMIKTTHTEPLSRLAFGYSVGLSW